MWSERWDILPPLWVMVPFPDASSLIQEAPSMCSVALFPEALGNLDGWGREDRYKQLICE
jgi:hypothetical protein